MQKHRTVVEHSVLDQYEIQPRVGRQALVMAGAGMSRTATNSPPPSHMTRARIINGGISLVNRVAETRQIQVNGYLERLELGVGDELTYDVWGADNDRGVEIDLGREIPGPVRRPHGVWSRPRVRPHA